MDSIVAAATLTSADIVVEVGAGLGMLTKKLVELGKNNSTSQKASSRNSAPL